MKVQLIETRSAKTLQTAVNTFLNTIQTLEVKDIKYQVALYYSAMIIYYDDLST